MGRTLGIPPTTIQSWADTGRVPAHRQQTVLVAGAALDPPLRPDDFFAAHSADGRAPAQTEAAR